MPNLCLILEPLRLVAKDLTATLQDATGCRALYAASEAEALSLLATLPPEARLITAFVHMSPSAFAVSPLKEVLDRHGARIVLTASSWEPAANSDSGAFLAGGTDSGTGSAPWRVLPRPFATADVHRVLGLQA